MENFDIVSLSLGLFLLLTVIGILVVLGFGLKNLFSGRHEWSKIAVVMLPFVIFGGLYAFFQDFTQAGIGTLLTMIAVMVLFIFVSGLRGSFK
jgi:hypothetical protein